MLRLRSPFRAVALILGCYALACAGGKETFTEERAFTDDAGRVCRATLEKTSPGAPSVSESVSCEGDARACSAEATPCFELSVTTDTFRVMNCPACCRGSASSYAAADCSRLRCDRDEDCVYQRAVCTEGSCLCPDGVCE